MSYVVRHPSGQYVREWPLNDIGGSWFELVKKGSASGYSKSEARKAANQIPGATVEVR